jgi:hypothetical protein
VAGVNPYLEKLVTLYARHGIEGIRNEPALLEKEFGKSLEELSNDWTFPGANVLVEDLQQRIEDWSDKLKTPDTTQQISECLKLLLDAGLYEQGEKSTRDLKLEILRELLVQRLGGAWSAPQLAHFDFVLGKIKEWNIYFLSYTNDGAHTTNQVYQQVIQRYVPPDVLKQRNQDQENLLADAVVERLGKRLLTRSFYDKQKIKVGDDLKAKIGPAAGGSFAFVILVQMETFDVVKDPNWCFEEYMLFTAANQSTLAQAQQYQQVFIKRFNAMLAGEKNDVYPPLPPIRYRSWIDRIFVSQRNVALPRDPDAFDAKVAELANEILNLTFQIIQSVPA